MAFQLIYSSAPRLLQAGRTGFGTVAMHTAIPGWLQAEIERVSQFSRVQGLDASRIVVRHMVLGQGDRIHHVVSRIADAGADYTGRTNHIAHHFVFTASEAAKASAAGVTPADVILFLTSQNCWVGNWTGEPRLLSDQDILDVATIPQSISLPAESYWGTLIPGKPESAAILAPGKTSEACWIVYPPAWRDHIVYAMGESLVLHNTPWSVSFTNDLQPTDNEQQIAWRGIPSDSPLLSKARASVRPCIDLESPDSIGAEPVAEYVEHARTGLKPLPKSRVPTVVAPSAAVASPPAPVEKIQMATPSSVHSNKPSFEKRAIQPRQDSFPKRPAYIYALLGAILFASVGFYFAYPIYQNRQLAEDKKAEIRGIFKGAPNLESGFSLDDLKSISQFAEAYRRGDIPEAQGILNGFPNQSADWHSWKVYANSKLDVLKKDKNSLKIAEKYRDLVRYPNLDRSELRNLLSEFPNEEEKMQWDNALSAIESIGKNVNYTGDKSFPKSLENISTSNELEKKLNEHYQKLISLSPPPAVVTNPENKSETQNIPSTEDLEYKIFVISDLAPSLVPKENEKFALIKENTKIYWEKIGADIDLSIWDKPDHYSKYPKTNNRSFVVANAENGFALRYIINPQDISKELSESATSPSQDGYSLDKTFLNFLKKLLDDKNSKIQFEWKVDIAPPFQQNSIARSPLQDGVFKLGNVWQKIIADKNALKTKLDNLVFKKSLLESELAAVKKNLDDQYPAATCNWKDFEAKIDKLVDKDKHKTFFKKWAATRENAKKFVEEFEKFSKAKKQDDFSKFLDDFKKLDSNVKKLFFFTGESWNPADMQKFKSQFDSKDNFQKLQSSFQNKENELEEITKEDKNLQSRIQSLEQIMRRNSIRAETSIFVSNQVDPLFQGTLEIPTHPPTQ